MNEFEKYVSTGWKPLSQKMLREELRDHVIGVETMIAMITTSGEKGYFIKEIGTLYRNRQSQKKQKGVLPHANK